MTGETSKYLKNKTPMYPAFKFMTFWPNNIKSWFCYAEVGFHKQNARNPRVQFFRDKEGNAARFGQVRHTYYV